MLIESLLHGYDSLLRACDVMELDKEAGLLRRMWERVTEYETRMRKEATR